MLKGNFFITYYQLHMLFPTDFDSFLDSNMLENFDNALTCYACKALNGDTSLPCWSLSNQTVLTDGLEYKSSDEEIPDNGNLYKQKCNDTQKFCKV